MSNIAAISVQQKPGGVCRVLVVALAASVFILVTGAKLSLYEPPHPGSISPAAASRLWVTGDKIKSLGNILPVFWLATLLLLRPPVRRSLPEAVDATLSPRHLGLLELYRFLRPPPAL